MRTKELPGKSPRGPWARRLALTRHRAHRLDPTVQGLLWSLTAGLGLVWRSGLASYRPRHVGGQFTRGVVHTSGLALCFVARPQISRAETTASGFTGPIFVM